MSSNSWGPPAPWGGVSPVAVSSWGTAQTYAPLPKLSNTPTTIPISFGSPTQTVVQVGSPSWDPRSRTPSSHTVFSPHVASGSVESKSSSSSIISTGPVFPSLNPCLLLNSPNRLAVDFSMPPSQMPPHPSMGASAFSPNMTSARIIVQGPTIWFFELPHSPFPLTVASILSQIYYFLQQVESSNDALSSRLRSDVGENVYPGTYRDQNLQRGGYGTGVRRIDLLGSRCCLKGFEPAREQNAWILHFRSR